VDDLDDLDVEYDDGGGGGSGAFSGLSGAATMRGAVLIGIAVLIGVVLLGKGFDSGFLPSASGDPSDQVATGDGDEGNGDEGTGDDGATTTEPPPTTRVPAEVRVQVLNSAAPVSGSAGTTTEFLSALGYNVIAATNADDRAATATVVYAASGFEADAQAIATSLGLSVTPQPMPVPPPGPAPADANVVIVLGPDFTPPDPATAATTTTTAG
jgi:LytR cell envelope-related transcriptional attenuator